MQTAVPELCDITDEPERLKQRYGVDSQDPELAAYARQCLLARHLVERGVSTNVASFIGATTLRIHVVGYEDRRPTSEELSQMKELVRAEMERGALGIGSSLIYAPAFYADTAELIELCKVAAEYEGIYISHIRSEGNKLLESVDEFLEIVRRAGIAGEIYHLKATGKNNWHKLDDVISKIERYVFVSANAFFNPEQMIIALIQGRRKIDLK